MGPPLIKHITFTKVKATADDVLVILRTLYERAADLGIDAKTRISFHANVLLAAEGGFRPGTLSNYLRICIRKLAESRNVLCRTTFTSKLVEENCWWLRLCFLVETLNLSSIPGYTWNEIAESRDNLLVKSAANGKTDL